MTMQFAVETTEFVKPELVNPFIELVDQHIVEAAENPAIAKTVTVDVNDASRAQLFYQRAANAKGKTAKLRAKDESAVKAGKPDEDGNPTKIGNVKLTFTITERHKARRGKDAAPAQAEAPAAEAEVAPEA